MNKAYPSRANPSNSPNQAAPQLPGSFRSGGLPQPSGSFTDRENRKREAAKRNAGQPSAKTLASQKLSDPITFWDQYYSQPKSNDDPEDVLGLVALLRVDKKFRDIEGVLRGYLRHHSDLAEVWMYDVLLTAIEINKGDEEEAKVLVGYAAHLARDSDNPNDLFQVADILLLRNWLLPVGAPGYKANLGEILEKLEKKVPHRIEPMLMNMLLAERTANPARMAEAVDSILSLGWPGKDEGVRRETKSRTEALAKTLKASGREDEAKAMLERLAESSAQDLVIRLKWQGTADLDLVVTEPLGASANYDTPRTVFGGSLIWNGRGTKPESKCEEVYISPRAFDGNYTVKVSSAYNSPEDPKSVVRTAELEVIKHQGTSRESRQTYVIDLTKEPVAPVVVELTGGRRTEVLPFLAPQPVPPLPEKLTARIQEKMKAQGKPKAIGAGGSRSEPTSKPGGSKPIVIPDYQPKSTKAIDLTNPKKPE